MVLAVMLMLTSSRGTSRGATVDVEAVAQAVMPMLTLSHGTSRGAADIEAVAQTMVLMVTLTAWHEP